MKRNLLKKIGIYGLICILWIYGNVFAKTVDFSNDMNLKPLSKEDLNKPIITFHFEDLEIRTVAEYLARLSNIVVIMDDEIKGKISVSVPGKVTLSQAYNIIMTIFNQKGITLIRTDKFLKVIQQKDSVKEPVDITFGADPNILPDEERIVTHIIPVKWLKAETLQSQIMPFISNIGNVFVNEDTNDIIVTDFANNIRRIIKLIVRLDRYDSDMVVSANVKTIVYPIRNMKVKDIAEALKNVFTESDQKQKYLVKLTPVESTNSLIVSAKTNIHQQIEKTISELDKRLKQVLIEAQVVEVTYNNDTNYGMDIFKYLENNRIGEITAQVKNTISNAAISIGIKNKHLEAAFKALRALGSMHVLTAPRVITKDNKKAIIQVGQEQPILKSVTDVGNSTGKTVSDYVYKDVGIQMEVTPQINVDKDVSLDIKFTATDILTMVDFHDVKVPLMGKRYAETSVVIENGHTLVLGGLIKHYIHRENSTVPVLGDIPLFGTLFSNIVHNREKNELLVFITPHVIENSNQGDSVTDRETGEMSKKFIQMKDQEKNLSVDKIYNDQIVEKTVNDF